MTEICFTPARKLAALEFLLAPVSQLPVGLQIVGRYRDDVGVLQLAHAFEQETGAWRQRPSIATA